MDDRASMMSTAPSDRPQTDNRDQIRDTLKGGGDVSYSSANAKEKESKDDKLGPASTASDVRKSDMPKKLKQKENGEGEEIKAPVGLKIELTAKQKLEIKDAFVACDTNASGYMSVTDLKIALRALGFEPRKNEIRKIIEKVDKANSGRLCFTDFMEVISMKLAEKDSRDEILKAFKLFDKDQTGFITFENLRLIAIELGEGLNDEEIKEMIEEADMDSDGAVNQEEFFRIMKKTSLY